MSATDTTTLLAVHLEAACQETACTEMAGKMYLQLNTEHYTTGVSILPMPESLDEWRAEHRTARKRADRAQRLGYRFDTIDRSRHNDAIYEINRSLPTRQGRPMSDGYTRRHNHGPLPHYPCDRHAIHTYGVLEGDTLRAYLSLYRIGDLGLVSMILGHGAHLDDGVMFLLMQGTIEAQIQHAGVLYYNKHCSGKPDGLVWYKERLGYSATDIEWVL